MTTPEMRSAVAIHATVNKLAGLQDAISEVRATRMVIEESEPITSSSCRMIWRLDKLVDRLEERAALLKKSIECGG